MESLGEADKLASGCENSSGWWRRNKRPPEGSARRAAAAVDRKQEAGVDNELAQPAEQPLWAARARVEGSSSSSNNSNNNESSGGGGGNNGTLAAGRACREPPARASNNNGQSEEDSRRRGRSGQQLSYSKIFSQYLPAYLSANSSASNKGQPADCEQQTADVDWRPSSSRVASALNRLSGLKKSLSSSPLQPQTPSRRDNNNNSYSASSGADSSKEEEEEETGAEEEEKQRKSKVGVKRKGFLYLKRATTFDIVQRSGSKLVTRIRDLNNNSNNSGSGRSDCYAGQSVDNNNYQIGHHDEHKTRLIEDSDQDSERSQEEYLSHKQQKQLQAASKESRMHKRSSRRPEPQLRSHEKSDGPLLRAAFCVVALGMLVCVAASAGLIKSAAALQSPQAAPLPPFATRSQQQPAEAPPSSSRPLAQPAAGSLVANVNCNKIRGHVTLTPNLQGGTSVSAQIATGPPGEFYQWSVHQFPVKPGAAMCSCSALILGSKLIDMSQLHGNLPSEQEQNVQSSINLFGPDSPVGHSLMLRGLKTGVVACATFLPTSRKSNYRAKFHAPLSGSVTIFQTAFGTSFTSHLMYSNGTRRHSVHQFDLVKSDDDIITTPLQPVVPVAPSGGRLASQLEQSFEQLAQREHDNELNQCKRLLRADASGEALLRNSSYQLSVSTENFGMRGRTSIVLPQIPFETFSSVYVVIYSEYNSNEPIACAPLRFVKPKQAAAKFQTVSVQGSVTFTQDSPYDVTVARINLNLPNSDGHSYGIDELPMIIRRKSDTRVCPNIREIIYNPHHVEPSSVPPEGEATSDQYAVGDLSGKYGSLTGKSSEKLQANDYNLPLFGATSIIGRAMTIYSADGVAIACSNVELTTPMTTAFATFDYGIQGQFIFRQPANDCNGDTYVYIEVSKPVLPAAAASSQPADSNSRSLDHNWHIHVNPVDSGLEHLSSTDCAPAAGHYNPYNISTSGIYTRDCTPFNVLRCELGDLSSKMFTIDIPPYRVRGGQEPEIGKFFGTDIDLPLCGPVSVVNRSVVVHVSDFGMQRLACSTVIEFKPRSSNN